MSFKPPSCTNKLVGGGQKKLAENKEYSPVSTDDSVLLFHLHNKTFTKHPPKPPWTKKNKIGCILMHARLSSHKPVTLNDNQEVYSHWNVLPLSNKVHVESKDQTRCFKRHTSHTHTHVRIQFLPNFFCLAVNVPAEEMMLHQHILHALFQWPLLLLLEQNGPTQQHQTKRWNSFE